MIVTARVPVRIDFAGAWTDVDTFAVESGGAVVNATIDQYIHGRLEVREDCGIEVSYRSDLPAGSGLGSSSAMNVCWLSLIQSQLHPGMPAEAIAEMACRLEQTLGVLGGKQDQYAAALGGFNLLRFSDMVEIE